MSSVIDAKICTCERERDSQEKQLAQLKDIISKLSIIASQSCFKFLPELKLTHSIIKLLRKCSWLGGFLDGTNTMSFYFDLHRLKKERKRKGFWAKYFALYGNASRKESHDSLKGICNEYNEWSTPRMNFVITACYFVIPSVNISMVFTWIRLVSALDFYAGVLWFES